MRLTSRSGLIVTAATIGAICAPTASARVSLEPGQSAHIDRGVSPVLQPPRPSELRAIQRAEAQKARRLAYELPATAPYSNAEWNAYASAAHPVASSPPVTGAPSNAFDYSDAAVGAGIAGGIVLLITAGNVTVRRRSRLHHG
jgi:hypothetical protein